MDTIESLETSFTLAPRRRKVEELMATKIYPGVTKDTIGSEIGPETSHTDDDGDADAEDNYLAIVNKNGDKGRWRDEDPPNRVSLGIG